MSNNLEKKYLRSSDWSCSKVLDCDVSVLVPTITKRADLTKIVQLNESGSFIWDQLENAKSLSELQTAFNETFEIDNPQKLATDIQIFITDSLEMGVIHLS